MYVQTLDASAINALAISLPERYPASVSVTSDDLAPDTVVAAWREMSALHAAACAALERELGERHGLGVSDFEVLDRLADFRERYPAVAIELVLSNRPEAPGLAIARERGLQAVAIPSRGMDRDGNRRRD